MMNISRKAWSGHVQLINRKRHNSSNTLWITHRDPFIILYHGYSRTRCGLTKNPLQDIAISLATTVLTWPWVITVSHQRMTTSTQNGLCSRENLFWTRYGQNSEFLVQRKFEHFKSFHSNSEQKLEISHGKEIFEIFHFGKIRCLVVFFFFLTKPKWSGWQTLTPDLVEILKDPKESGKSPAAEQRA